MLWNIVQIHKDGKELWPRQTICQLLNHYVYNDLDIWPITLDQGHDTSLPMATIVWNIVQIYNEDQEL
jgi:hypothetical protein